MIRIHRSNKLKILAYHLAKDLKAHSPEDPLEPAVVVVPNRDMARWLKLYLAEKNSIAANIDFILPAEWQYRMIRRLYPDLPDLLPGDPGPLAWAVFSVMMDDRELKRFPRADRYVSSQPQEIRERTVMQLAKKIASVYDQYLVYRPEMILGWQQGQTGKGPDEKWQSDLWNLLEKKRLVREQGVGFPNKAELISEAIRTIRSGKIAVEQTVMFFNTGLLPRPVLQMAQSAANQQDLILYQSSVTKDSNTEYLNRLLSAFGDEAAGLDYLLDPLDAEILNEFDDESSQSSALNAIQNSIISDDIIPSGSLHELSGIEIHSCHTPMREIEVLYQFLLRRFEEDPELHPDDILVVMPDIETYKPIIHAVFGTEQEGVPNIPYHVDYRRVSTESTTRSFIQLLDLIDSRFKFSDVMDFLMEPAVHQSLGLGENAVRRLKRWVEENSVIWGLNAAHRREEDQPGTDSQTWHSALYRGWHGIIHGDTSDPFSNESTLRFSDIQGQDMEDLWAGFSHMMGRFEELNQSIKRKRTSADWCKLMETQLDYFFESDSSSTDQRSPVRLALNAIQDETKTAGFDEAISYSMFRSHFKQQLDKQSASPAHFTRGVTFSSMVPVRSIPAKVIALIGLNESVFPRKPKDPDFDLMAADPRPFERNPKKQDRSLFLESILASESFHYCSYIGRSRTDNETMPPSPIVSEWLTTLSEVSGNPVTEILTEEPLHGFSADNFKQNRSFSEIGYLTAKNLKEQEKTLPGLYSTSEISHEELTNQLTVSHIGQFISNPLRSFIRDYFTPRLSGLEDSKDEFSLNGLETHLLFERVFGWRFEGVSVSAISKMLNESGVVPAGWLGERKVGSLIASADTAIESAKDRGFELTLHNVEAPLDVHGTQLTASFLSYSSEQYLDIIASKGAGDRFLKSWIKHLASQCAESYRDKRSWLLCDLKKGDPKWVSFDPVSDPVAELNRFISLYEKGHKAPLLTFPNATFEYLKQERENKKNPLGKAVTAFEGTDFSPYGENSDPFVTLMLGEGAPFREEYMDSDLSDAISVMLNHMEEH